MWHSTAISVYCGRMKAFSAIVHGSMISMGTGRFRSWPAIWIGDVSGDGQPELVIGGSVTVMYDRQGQELWRYEGSVEAQHVALGKFRGDLPGLQIAGLNRWSVRMTAKGAKEKMHCSCDVIFRRRGIYS